MRTTSTTLPFFYAIHLHLGNDRLPYDSKLMKEDELNADKAENMLAIVNAIKAVADKHGLPIDWQPPWDQPRVFAYIKAPTTYLNNCWPMGMVWGFTPITLRI